MTRRWCCLWLIALTVTAGARQADQDRRAAERPALVGLDAAAVEKLIGPPGDKDELADSNEAYWTYTTSAGILLLHFQNATVLDIDPADFPIERILRSSSALSAATPWTVFVDRFLAEPDHAGDLSAASFGEDLVRTRARLAELRAMDASRLSPDEALDRRFVETLLVRREIDQARLRRWRMDPRVYMQSLPAIDTRIASAGEHAPQAVAAAVLRLLKTIPQNFRFGRRNLTLSVPHFQELALAMASAGATTLKTGVATFAETLPDDQGEAMLEANAVALAALNDWTDYLSKDLMKRPAGYTAVGIETYSSIVHGEYLLQYGIDELYEFAQRELERTQEQLEDAAAEVDDSSSWLTVAGDQGDTAVDDIDADTVTALYRAAGETARTHLDAARFVAMPGPGKEDALADWRFANGETEAERLFGTFDPAVVLIRAHAAYGDRVRAIYQRHNASAVRRERSASTFTDGWRRYVEQMLEEQKLVPDDRAALRLLQLRLLAIARVAVDIGLHTHRLTDAQASSLLTARVGLTKAAAEREIASSIDDPGSGLGYLGLTEITRLRDDVHKARGGAFSLADFHERLLKTGPMPLTLVRTALLN
jgi:hypothetical protein